MNIEQEYFDKYRYSIRGPLGFKYISQPINWNDDNKTFKRSLDVHGVFTNLSNDLQFHVGDGEDGGGYVYLKDTYNQIGINAVVMLVKEENISGKWVEAYRGFFDFSTYTQNPYTISIKFNESGIYEKIKSRQREKLEVDRITTMDGDPIEPMTSEIVGMDGRKVLIISEINVSKAPTTYTVPISSNDGSVNIGPYGSHVRLEWGGGREYNAAMVPLTMVAEQDGNVQSVTDYKCPVNTQDWNHRNASSTANMFYDESPNPKTLTMDINFSVARVIGNADEFRVELLKFGGALGLQFISSEDLFYIGSSVLNHVYHTNISAKKVTLQTGESLAISVHAARGSGRAGTMFFFERFDITITDETYADPTQAKFIMPFETLDRIIHVITNRKNRLVSTALGRKENKLPNGDLYPQDGYASLTGLTNGFWVRDFNTEMITTSFDDFISSFAAIWQIGYGIEKNSFNETVRVEHISYFYQEVATIKLSGQPSNIVRKCAKDYFYSGITVGYSEPSGTILYEEVLGLDEYNIKNTFTTPITRVDNKLVNESKYRADSYGTEFARRKPRAKFPEEDTRYDLSVMVLDLKRGNGSIFQQRKWADDFIVPVPFDKESTGIYSPETASNLRFSPINILKRMGYWIKGGFMKNLDEYVRYSSSNGNSKLKTHPLGPGEFETAENGNILCSDFNKNLFNPEIINFKFEVNTMLMKQVTGSTMINGNQIMNYYGLVEFVNEYGENEYGFLLSLEPNGEGEWELLSSTKRKTTNAEFANCKGVVEPPINLHATDITP